jgi:exonuclease SbcC
MFLGAQQARLDGMSAELAGQLVDGEPCAVCGSLDHPAPASGGAPPPGPEAVQQAEDRWQARRQATAAAQAELAGVEQLVATRNADLAGARERHPDAAATPVDELERRLRDGRTRINATRSKLSRLGDVEGRRADAHTRHAAVAGAVEELERATAVALGTIAEVEGRVGAQEKTHATLLADHQRYCPCASESGDTAVDDHRRLRTAAAQLEAALIAAAKADAELAEVRVAAGEALSANGFETEDDAVAASLPSAHLLDLRRQLRELEQRRAAAEATLADPEVIAAEQTAPADIAATETAVEAARLALRRAQHSQTAAEVALRSFTQIRESLLTRVAEIGPLAVRSAQVAELADTATGIGGQNTLRMRLTAFVLAARLEKVAALANERLRVMGDGRYQLAHSDDRAAGGRRSGLGLLVRDQWTGQVRDTASLSGGESFMASLALALGLADAVREEAGGFDLNTLFIDEGFGTLDDESLEQVMSVLDGLRDGGRCVGVVSHVSDLRSRVPAQVRVDKTSTGSSVTVLGLDSPAA